MNHEQELLSVIIKLTKITQAKVEDRPIFRIGGADFVKHMVNVVTEYENETNTTIDNIIFVAHNGQWFDVPFLFQK